MQTAEVVALVKPDPREDALRIRHGLEALANRLTYDIAPADAASVYTQLKGIEDILTDMGKLARDRLLAYVKSEGTQVTEGGSLKASFGNFEVSAIVRSAGYDAKKVQVMLRSKGLDATAGCDTEIKYKPNPDKLEALVSTGKMTAQELKSCKADVEYRLERPVRINHE